MPADKQLGLLRDMLDSAKAIRHYVTDVTHDQFLGDSEKQDAVLRRLEIIGEAATRLSPETQAQFPTLPFRAMRGMRNIIIHDYGDVDLEQVWTTVTNDLEALIRTLEQHFTSR